MSDGGRNDGGRAEHVTLLLALALDANRGWPEMRKTHPALVEKYERQQREVASKVHRTPPRSLDGMRFQMPRRRCISVVAARITPDDLR